MAERIIIALGVIGVAVMLGSAAWVAMRALRGKDGGNE
jgi:hypothetical protein